MNNEIICQIGYGQTRLTVGWLHDILTIDIEPLLEAHPIGNAEGISCYPVQRCRLFIHNEAGLQQLKKIVRIAGRELKDHEDNT